MKQDLIKRNQSRIGGLLREVRWMPVGLCEAGFRLLAQQLGRALEPPIRSTSDTARSTALWYLNASLTELFANPVCCPTSAANLQVGNCSVAVSALEEVQARAAAAEEKVKRAEAALARLQAGDRTAGISAEMAKLQEDIGALRKVRPSGGYTCMSLNPESSVNNQPLSSGPVMTGV